MRDSNCVELSALDIESYPFQHFYKSGVLTKGIDKDIFEWFENIADWELTETNFYTQYEMSLLDVTLPSKLSSISSAATIDAIRDSLKRVFNKSGFDLVGITAHKLVDGHKIGVHNDYIEGEETHRFIVQINPLWSESNGGFLMLFNSPRATDVVKIVQPLNNTAFAFEISPISYHAVSAVYDFSRYTLVYTFREQRV